MLKTVQNLGRSCHQLPLTMTLKLYGTSTSICTRRVSIVLHELRLSYDFILVDLDKSDQKSPEYLEMNLYGQVPLLVSYHPIPSLNRLLMLQRTGR